MPLNPNISYFSDGTPIPDDGEYHQDPRNEMSSVKTLRFWMPSGVTQFLSAGNTASLGLFENGLVYKYPHDKDDAESRRVLEVEHTILSALGRHDRIVKYAGRAEHGLLFERAEHGDLRSYVTNAILEDISPERRIRWAKQAAEAIAFIHSHGVIHCDIHPTNFLIDNELNLLLCDFAGSLFNELDGGALESERYFLPREAASTPNVRTDLFALGSVLYFIVTGHEPFEDLKSVEVTARFTRGEYPNTKNVERGDVILGCWQGRFNNAESLLYGLDNE